MALEEDGAAFVFQRSIQGGGGGEVFGEFLALVDDDTVEFDRHAGPSGAVAVGVEFGVGKIDVISLPGEGREAHVNRGCGDGVDAATLVHEAIESEGVEDLGFPAAAKVNAAVSASLPAGVGLVGSEEFEVESVVFEGLFAGRAGREEKAIFHLPVDPAIGIGAIEENGGTLRGLGSESGALAGDAGEFCSRPAGELCGLSGDGQAEVLIFWKDNDFTFPLSAEFDAGLVLGPSESGQSACEEIGIELSVTQGHDLHPEGRAFLEILALNREIRVFLEGFFKGGPSGLC